MVVGAMGMVRRTTLSSHGMYAANLALGDAFILGYVVDIYSLDSYLVD